MGIDAPYFAVDGRAVALYDSLDVAGPADRPAIVLVHGSVVTRKMWLPQLRGLSYRYRVIAPDLPGHGGRAGEPFTFAGASRALSEVIESEAGGRALVVGASLGGYVAIDLAHRDPARVAGLVIAGASRNFMGALGLYLRIVGGAMRRGWIKQTRERAEERTRRLFSPALADIAEEQIKAGVYPDSLGPAFAEMAGRDFQLLLADYPGPTLILNGERDAGPRAGAARFARAARRAEVATIPDAGHACSLDQPDPFNSAVRAFADKVFA
jgi:pimeloyl-ACP methyl ester carboxylesterase